MAHIKSINQSDFLLIFLSENDGLITYNDLQIVKELMFFSIVAVILLNCLCFLLETRRNILYNFYLIFQFNYEQHSNLD